MALCHYLKERVSTGEKQNPHFYYLPACRMCRLIQCVETAAGLGLSTPDSERLHSISHSDCLFQASVVYSEPSSLHADSCFHTQVKLQWNIIIWRHVLTLTVHKVQLLSSPLRAEQ